MRPRRAHSSSHAGRPLRSPSASTFQWRIYRALGGAILEVFMSGEQDFEVVRKSWEVTSQGGMQAGLHLLCEDVELVPFGAALQGKSYRGHKGALEWWETEIVPNWHTFEVIAEDFQPAGNRLVVFGRWRARGRSSGVDLEMPATWVVEVRDGKIARWETFTDRAEALDSIDSGAE